MKSLVLPKPACPLPELLRAVTEQGLLTDDWDAVAVTVPPECFVPVPSMAFLGAWGHAQVQAGRRVELHGNENVLRYLSRMDLHRHLGQPEIEMRRHSEEGRFLPLRLIEGPGDTGPAVGAVRDLLAHQFERSETFLGSACWAVAEILDNILNHAATSEAGVICAQYFPLRHRLDVGICDVGRGIRASLGESRPLWSHGHAIETALKRGVTRDVEVGQGNGLAGTCEVAVQNGGSFSVWSGNALYGVKETGDRGFVEIAEVPGTGVHLALDTRRPVDLRSTWMASYAGTSYLGEGSLIQVQQVVKLVDASGPHLGTRAQARELRAKVREVLASSSAPLAVDFAGYESVTSSFMDELFGRLIGEIGRDVFRERVLVQNLGAADRGIADVAISQRLEGMP